MLESTSGVNCEGVSLGEEKRSDRISDAGAVEAGVGVSDCDDATLSEGDGDAAPDTLALLLPKCDSDGMALAEGELEKNALAEADAQLLLLTENSAEALGELELKEEMDALLHCVAVTLRADDEVGEGATLGVATDVAL